MARTILEGDVAPDFRLKDQQKEEVTLSGLRGRRVLLSFHPLAWTGVCAQQMKSLEDTYDRFEELGCLPLGVSVDTIPSKLAWAEDLGIERLSMLSDFWPHGGLAREMGLFREEAGTSMRANVLIDGDGRVAWVKVYEISQLPDVNEVLQQLEAMERKGD